MSDTEFSRAGGEATKAPEYTVCRMNAGTAPVILQQFAETEGVAPFAGATTAEKVESVRARLGHPNREIYYLVEDNRPRNVLATLQTTQTWGTPTSLDAVMAGHDLAHGTANTVAFFSITTFKGAKRVGDILLDAVASDLRENRPHLKTFVTLSPVYDFIQSLRSLPEEPIRGLPLSRSYAGLRHDINHVITSKPGKMERLWEELLSHPDTAMDLTRLCTRHVLTASRQDGKIIAADSAAAFHYRRGAALVGINMMGSSTPLALERSGRFTANYFYSPDERVIAANKAAYNGETPTPARSWKMHSMVGASMPIPQHHLIYA